MLTQLAPPTFTGMRAAVMRFDIAIVGGGINGAGIARDAAGRGLRTLLVERGDLGGATSSASSKLAHGGLRYLEHYQFGMVAEALAERETLLHAAPHLVRPMRFVMPLVPGLRPAWQIRAGLFLYDHLARRQRLPRSQRVDLRSAAYEGLKPEYAIGYAYSDCWVDDARLVIATARSAAQLGASVRPRTECIAARRDGPVWRLRLRGPAPACQEAEARVLVNAAGPWVAQFLADAVGTAAPFRLKLVQGSHIVVPRLYPGRHAYILQNRDRRVVFVYPYEDRYTLIGTTETEVPGTPGGCRATPHEVDYLCDAANAYFSKPVARDDVVWSFCGIRPLVDTGAASPSEVPRTSQLTLDASPGRAPLLSVVGGKITSYRRLSERVVERLRPWLQASGPWTRNAPLPGGELQGADAAGHLADLARGHPLLPVDLVSAIARRHGSLSAEVLGMAETVEHLGRRFGPTLCAAEIDYLMDHEWAHAAEDVLWRRTKEGLHLTQAQRDEVEHYMAARRRQVPRPTGSLPDPSPHKRLTRNRAQECGW